MTALNDLALIAVKEVFDCDSLEEYSRRFRQATFVTAANVFNFCATHGGTVSLFSFVSTAADKASFQVTAMKDRAVAGACAATSAGEVDGSLLPEIKKLLRYVEYTLKSGLIEKY